MASFSTQTVEPLMAPIIGWCIESLGGGYHSPCFSDKEVEVTDLLSG